MKIEVGDWIRSKDGFIGKVRKISYDNMEKSNYYICEKDNVMASNYLENIAKHNKNIIDLVEKDDYVNGYKVEDDIEGNLRIYINSTYPSKWAYIESIKIKSIVTHQQFANIEYKVEEDE